MLMSRQSGETLSPKSTPKPLKFRLQGLSWSPLATPWVVLGCLGALLEDLVEIFGEVGAKMGPRWTQDGPSWQQVAPKMGHDGAKMALLGSVGELLGAPGNIFGDFLHDLWKMAEV